MPPALSQRLDQLQGAGHTQYGYSGAWGVRDTGNGLLDMRNRTYDPTLGQFLTRDPLEATTGDAYNYAANNPIDLTDPTGLAPTISISINIEVARVGSAPPPPQQFAAYGFCWTLSNCGNAEVAERLNVAVATAPPGAGIRCDQVTCRRIQHGSETYCGTHYGQPYCGHGTPIGNPPPASSPSLWEQIWSRRENIYGCFSTGNSTGGIAAGTTVYTGLGALLSYGGGFAAGCYVGYNTPLTHP